VKNVTGTGLLKMSSKKKDLTSLISSQESAAYQEGLKQADFFTQKVFANRTNIAKPFCESIGLTFQSLKTSKTLTQANIKTSMSCAAGSPALTFQSAGNLKDSTGKGRAFGLNMPDLLAKLDLNTQSWRTSQTCLLALLENTGDGLAEYSETWPRSGMMRNGIAYRLPILAAGQNGTESGFLPTPTAVTDTKGSPKNRFYGSRTYRSLLREYLRDGMDDPIYPNPALSEVILGYPKDYTRLETA